MSPITPDLLTGVACGQWDGHRHQATSYVYVCMYVYIFYNLIYIYLFNYVLFYLYIKKIPFFWVNLRPFVQNMHLSKKKKKNVFLLFFSTFQENSFFATFGVFKLLGQNHQVEALVGGKSYLDVPLFANRSKHKNVGFNS